MTTAPHSGRPPTWDPQPGPRSAGDRSFGWSAPEDTRQDTPQDTGTPTGTDPARGTPTGGRDRNAARPERRPFRRERGATGTPDRNADADRNADGDRKADAADRNGAGPERGGERSDDPGATDPGATYYAVAPVDAALDDAALDVAALDVAALDDALDEDKKRSGDDVPAGRPSGARHRLLDDLRFVNEDMASLRKLLRFARDATYNLSHIAVVRAANIAFFWSVTAPVLTVAFFLLWAFAVRLHRTLTAAVIVGVIGPFANRLLDWLVPDGLDVSTWSATTWQWAGGALVVVGVGTAIALAGERRR